MLITGISFKFDAPQVSDNSKLEKGLRESVSHLSLYTGLPSTVGLRRVWKVNSN